MVKMTISTEMVYKFLTVQVCYDCPNNVGQQFDEADPDFTKKPCKGCQVELYPTHFNNRDKQTSIVTENKTEGP